MHESSTARAELNLPLGLSGHVPCGNLDLDLHLNRVIHRPLGLHLELRLEHFTALRQVLAGITLKSLYSQLLCFIRCFCQPDFNQNLIQQIAQGLNQAFCLQSSSRGTQTIGNGCTGRNNRQTQGHAKQGFGQRRDPKREAECRRVWMRRLKHGSILTQSADRSGCSGPKTVNRVHFLNPVDLFLPDCKSKRQDSMPTEAGSGSQAFGAVIGGFFGKDFGVENFRFNPGSNTGTGTCRQMATQSPNIE